MESQCHCALGRERFHGYLDGALPAPEMEQVAAHVAACERCGEEAAQFRALKAALHEMRTPNGSGDARDRVFSRYRDRAASDAAASPLRPAAAMRVHHWARHPSVSFAAAAAAAALIAFLPPVEPSGGRPALLPGPAEMSVLSERHDLHVAHVEGPVSLPGQPPGAARFKADE